MEDDEFTHTQLFKSNRPFDLFVSLLGPFLEGSQKVSLVIPGPLGK